MVRAAKKTCNSGFAGDSTRVKDRSGTFVK